MNNAPPAPPITDPREALLLLIGFGRDYAVTLGAQPATQRCVVVAMEAAARIVDQALVDGTFAAAQLAELMKAAPPQAELPLANPEGQQDAPA